MKRYLLRRLLRAVTTIFSVVVFVFLMVRAVPGDPVDAILGEQASAEDRALMRERLHLNDSLYEQFSAFATDVANGSLGHSFRHERTVSDMLFEVALPTIVLALSALTLALLIALPLGVLAAWRQGQIWDRLASTVGVFGLAIPNIWLGPMLILLFAVELRILPLPGDESGLTLLLPTITLGTAMAAILTRQTRAATADALARPFAQAAKARGLSPRKVLIHHGLRNALFPIVTIAGAQLGALLSGTVVVERIFERPGLGSLFLEAFFSRDLPVIQGVVLIVAFTYVIINLLLDLLYLAIDPRVAIT